MSHVNVQVLVDRAAAILAGKSTWGPQVTLLDLETISAEQRAELATAKEVEKPAAGAGPILDLTVSLPASYDATTPRLPTLAEASPEAAAAALDARIAQRAWLAEREAQQKAKRVAEWERSQAEWMARADDAILREFTYINRGLEGPYNGYSLPMRTDVADRVARLRAVLATQREEKAAMQAAVREATERRREIEAKARAARLVDWVERYCTEEERRRHKVGMLPETDILNAARAAIFAPLDAFPRFDRITKAEAREAHGHEEWVEVTFGSDPADEATAEEFAALEAIREVVSKRLPDNTTVELVDHWATIDDETAVSRACVKVAVSIDGIDLSRHYAAA